MLYEKNGTVMDGSRIVIVKNGFQTINPTEEMILADGWSEYVPEAGEEIVPASDIPFDEQLRGLMLDQYNSRTNITDEEALKRPLLVYDWSYYLEKPLVKGQIVRCYNVLYRVQKDIASLTSDDMPGSSDCFSLIESNN